jgi:hypothetical protein
MIGLLVVGIIAGSPERAVMAVARRSNTAPRVR